MKKLNTIEEFDGLYDLPGGCNILAAGKNTPIWNQNTQSIVMQYYNKQANPTLKLQDTVSSVVKTVADHLI